MAATSAFLGLFFTLLAFSGSVIQIQALNVGINYGQIANNLPSPSSVVQIFKSLNVSRVKLYDAAPNVLAAFANTNIEFIIGLGNELIPSMADASKAQSWIQQHVSPYISQTRITCILVGNEIFKINDQQLWVNLVPAMKSVHQALVNLGLDKQVTVTTAHSLDILSSSFPPSSGAFTEMFAQYIQAQLNFQAQIDSPFLINAYPFFAYMGNANEVPIEYVLFQPNNGTLDPYTNLKYDNMLYAQVDAVYSAIKRMGHSDIEVRISETGWPSKGDESEVGATPENAGLYNGNLLKRVQERQGTPAKPNVPIDIYVFALFNENMKPGPTSERNYGLFYPNGTSVYNIGSNLKDPGYTPTIIYSSAGQIKALSFFSLLFLFIARFI